MCNCQTIEGFQQSLSKAESLTKSTGETHVVYVHKAVGMSFVRKESELNNELAICCYFLPNGKEVIYTPKVAEKTSNIDNSNVEISVETIQPKKTTKKTK